MKLDKNRIFDFFKKSESKAAVLIKDKSKAQKTLHAAFLKANANQDSLGSNWKKIVLFIQLVKDFLSGQYTTISKRTIITIIGALIYFLSPIDVIPDFIPGMGIVDDVFVLGLVYKQVLKDLLLYQKWRDQKVAMMM